MFSIFCSDDEFEANILLFLIYIFIYEINIRVVSQRIIEENGSSEYFTKHFGCKNKEITLYDLNEMATFIFSSYPFLAYVLNKHSISHLNFLSV